jgi:hypothetical protein
MLAVWVAVILGLSEDDVSLPVSVLSQQRSLLLKHSCQSTLLPFSLSVCHRISCAILVCPDNNSSSYVAQCTSTTTLSTLSGVSTVDEYG